MTEKTPESTAAPRDARDVIKAFCARFRAAVRNGEPAPFEALLDEAPAAIRDGLLAELVAEDAQLRVQRGETSKWGDYAERFADCQAAAWKGFRYFDPGATAPPGLDTGEHSLSDTGPYDSSSVDVGGEEDSSVHPTPQQLGDYEFLRKLGEGTFGVVFQASHPTRGSVAIKVLKPMWSSVAECREMFLREARTTLQFDHPRVVRVLELNADAEPPYFVQEYVAGGSLSDRLRVSGKLPYREATELVIQIAEGLTSVHATRNYHRDLKPIPTKRFAWASWWA